MTRQITKATASRHTMSAKKSTPNQFNILLSGWPARIKGKNVKLRQKMKKSIARSLSLIPFLCAALRSDCVHDSRVHLTQSLERVCLGDRLELNCCCRVVDPPQTAAQNESSQCTFCTLTLLLPQGKRAECSAL